MAEKPPLHGLALALATFALATGTFMEVLDITIANVSVPHIAGDLGVSPNQGTWVITTYAVSNAISLLLIGFLAGRFGQVRVFLWAVTLFTLASVACGFSTSFEMLLTSRAIQGGVSGLMVPLSQTLILASYPRERRNVGVAIWAMTVMVAPVVGPVLGGWITDNIGWRWIFLLNVPVGIIVVFLSWEMLHDRETETQKVPIDWTGLALTVIWVGALQIMLDKGNELDWFDNGAIRVLAAITVISFVFFLIWEWNTPHPIVDLRLFLVRTFTVGTVTLSMAFALFFAGVVLLPLWLQTQMGYTALRAGTVLAPAGVFGFLLAPLVGRVLHRFDARYFSTTAFTIFAICFFMRSQFSTDSSYAFLALPQWIMGIGIAMFFPPLLSITLGDLPPQRIASGSGVMNFVRMISASFGASLSTTLWDHRTSLHAFTLIERLGPFDPPYRLAVESATASGLSPAAAHSSIAYEVLRQASIRGLDDIFWASSLGFVAIIVFVWLAPRPTRTSMAAH